MFCEKCGNELPDNATFCDRCGVQVSNMQQMPQQFSQPQFQQPYPMQNVPAKKNTGKGIVIGVIVTLLIAGLGVGGYFGYEYYSLTKNAEMAHEYMEQYRAEEQEKLEQEEKERAEEKAKAEEEARKAAEAEAAEKAAEEERLAMEEEAKKAEEDNNSLAEKFKLFDGVEESCFYWIPMYDPEAGTKVTSYDELLGKWKVMIQYYDFDDYIGVEYGFAEFTGDAEKSVMAFSPVSMQYNGEPPFSEEDDEDRIYDGWFTEEQGLYIGSTSSNLWSEYMSYDNDGEYFIGRLGLPDGTESVVYMVRP